MDIIIKRSTVAGKIPDKSSLKPGELALNIEDEILYSTKVDGTIFKINPVDEAPSDNNIYGRKNKKWVSLGNFLQSKEIDSPLDIL